MKKSTLNILLISVMSLIGFYACEIEPDFPLPGFEIGDKELTIRRDSVPEYFDIVLGLNVPNGVSSIEVLDGLTGEHIDNVEGYTNQKSFNMNYEVDLRPISTEIDTVLNFTFRVIDNKEVGFNRSVRLYVKKNSIPEIINFEGGENILLSGPLYKPEGIASTGAVAMKSVAYNFEGEQRFFIDFEGGEPVYDYVLSAGVSFVDDNLQLDTPYSFNIVVTDVQGRSYQKDLSLTLSAETRLPSSITYFNHSNRAYKITIGMDDMNRIDTIRYSDVLTGSTSNFVLSYDGDNKVTKLKYYVYSTTFKEYQYKIHNFAYNDNGQLGSMRYVTYTIPDDNPDVKEDYEEKVVGQRFTYDEAGLINSFYGQSSVIDGPFYSDPFGVGLPVFSSYWQTYDPTTLKASSIQTVTEFKTVFMPTYIEGLPPFVNLGIHNNWFYALFTRKLMPDKVRAIHEEYIEAGSTFLYEPNYSYTTNDDKLIDRMILTFTEGGYFLKGKTNIYQFNYE